MKFFDQFEKFMELEMDLDEEVKKLYVLVVNFDLYLEFVWFGLVLLILGLFGYDNMDIVMFVVILFSDLIDEDVIGESDELVLVLVDVLIENNVLEFLV